MDAAIRGCMAPSKLYGILAAGVPTLALVPPGGSVSRTIEREQVGYCAEPNNSAAFVSAVARAMADGERLRDYGDNARELAVRQYDRRVSCDLFAELLDELSPVAARVRGASLAPHTPPTAEPVFRL